MHYLGKPGPHHSKERGEDGRGAWGEGGSLPADLILLTFSPPSPPRHPPALPPSSSERWTALYPVSTEPPFPNKRIINGAFLGAGLSCTITPAPDPILPSFFSFLFFSFFLQMGTEKRGYELSTQHLATTKQYQVPQCKHHISATWETFKHLFLLWRRRKYASAARPITRA